MKYYKISITKTAKPFGKTDEGYQEYDDGVVCLKTKKLVREELKKLYSNCKKVKMYNDRNGQSFQCGNVYCYNGKEHDGGVYKHYHYQDWVTVNHVTENNIINLK